MAEQIREEVTFSSHDTGYTQLLLYINLPNFEVTYGSFSPPATTKVYWGQLYTNHNNHHAEKKDFHTIGGYATATARAE